MNMTSALDDQRLRPEQMHCMEVWGGNTAIDKWFELPGLNAWVFSDPHGRSTGGGDVYYISSCASGRITRILLADVSGHGEGASDIAIGLRELMRDHVNLIHQSKFVRAINREFTDSDFTGKFATAVIGTYFAPRRSYEFCSAGHPPPLLYRAATETWTLLDTVVRLEADNSPGFPLGIDAATEYAQQTITLNHGDAVLTYSDAVIESAAANGELLMTEGLLDVVRSTSMRTPETFIAQLVATIRDMAPKNLAGDDTTIMLCQTTDSKPSLKNNLLAPLRILRRAADNTTLA
jgi:sigma-B regulation protein RsbU (phosphoserine phosphatase)